VIVLGRDDEQLAERLANLRAWRARTARPPAWMERRIAELEVSLGDAAELPMPEGVADSNLRDPTVTDASTLDLERAEYRYVTWLQRVARHPMPHRDDVFIGILTSLLEGVRRELARRRRSRRTSQLSEKEKPPARWEYALDLADERGWTRSTAP
jgi:hypothetical protein